MRQVRENLCLWSVSGAAKEWNMTRGWHLCLRTQRCAILSFAALEPRVFAWWNVIMLCNSVRAVYCGCTVQKKRILSDEKANFMSSQAQRHIFAYQCLGPARAPRKRKVVGSHSFCDCVVSLPFMTEKEVWGSCANWFFSGRWAAFTNALQRALHRLSYPGEWFPFVLIFTFHSHWSGRGQALFPTFPALPRARRHLWTNHTLHVFRRVTRSPPQLHDHPVASRHTNWHSRTRSPHPLREEKGFCPVWGKWFSSGSARIVLSVRGGTWRLLNLCIFLCSTDEPWLPGEEVSAKRWSTQCLGTFCGPDFKMSSHTRVQIRMRALTKWVR